MRAEARLEQIAALVEERGFVSVYELGTLLNVSGATIRRDLQRLQAEKRLRRTHGGATALRPTRSSTAATGQSLLPAPALEGFFVFDRVDVLIATSVDPQTDQLLLDRMEQRNIPIVTESIGMPGMKTLVAVNDYQASIALGRWTGEYAERHFNGQGLVLDLTYQLENTQARSQGFMEGMRQVLPEARTSLSINVQSSHSVARQLTADALQVYPDINIIFAINDTSASGAIQACRDLGLDPDSLLVLPFGLEGDTMKNELILGEYCKASVAMFPEIVGPVCIEAAINAYNRQPMPAQLVTPYAILTPETLPEFYRRNDSGWHLRWGAVNKSLTIPLDIGDAPRVTPVRLPSRIGFVVPFIEHEWYQNLITNMQSHLRDQGMVLEVVDVDQNLKDEVTVRKRGIAGMAASQVQAEDVILISAGQISAYLAEELVGAEDITVITNSLQVFDILRGNHRINLISTGGLLRSANETLVGLTGVGALQELRADKLFVEVDGVTLDFGLSDTNMAEATMKQAMLRAARNVVLLADHTKFGQESVVQLAPADVVNTLITDNALAASDRLEFATLGVEVMVAKI
jgi:DeoR/GlpR family transcriptional regulator of sugar metabolism